MVLSDMKKLGHQCCLFVVTNPATCFASAAGKLAEALVLFRFFSPLLDLMFPTLPPTFNLLYVYNVGINSTPPPFRPNGNLCLYKLAMIQWSVCLPGFAPVSLEFVFGSKSNWVHLFCILISRTEVFGLEEAAISA